MKFARPWLPRLCVTCLHAGVRADSEEVVINFSLAGQGTAEVFTGQKEVY